jgi:hypothetical protein
VVITGTVKSDGGWVLSVSVRNGPTGKSVDKLRYPLRGPRLDPGTLRRLADDIGPAVDRAAEAPPTGAPVEAGEGDGGRPALPPGAATEDENPLAPGEERADRKKDRKKEGAIERPSWTPWVDASVGLLLSGRNFQFKQANLPQFRSSVAAGLRLDATGYPLALLATKPGAGWNAITGLGFGLTFDWVFWPESVPCARDAMGECAMTTERFGTREYRLEMGLRWHWNVLNKPDRPELLASLQWGVHDFSITKRPDGSDVGPPDVSYSYVTIGLGGRVPIVPWFALRVDFNIHGVISTGAVQDPSQFGPGDAWGLRLALSLDFRVWQGLFVRASGFYERFGLSFNGMPQPGKGPIAGGAADQYYGGLLSVGYAY